MKSVTWVAVAFITGGMLLTSCRYKSNSSFNQQSSNVQTGVQTAAPLPTTLPDYQPAATQADSQGNDPQLLQAANESDQALNELDKSLQSDDTMNDLAATIAPANGSASDAYNTADQTLNDLMQSIQSVSTPAVP
jgi:hypothetical protein